jgi:hypothetical protein
MRGGRRENFVWVGGGEIKIFLGKILKIYNIINLYSMKKSFSLFWKKYLRLIVLLFFLVFLLMGVVIYLVFPLDNCLDHCGK